MLISVRTPNVIEVQARLDREAGARQDPPVVVRFVVVHMDAVAVDLFAEAVPGSVQDRARRSRHRCSTVRAARSTCQPRRSRARARPRFWTSAMAASRAAAIGANAAPCAFGHPSAGESDPGDIGIHRAGRRQLAPQVEQHQLFAADRRDAGRAGQIVRIAGVGLDGDDRGASQTSPSSRNQPAMSCWTSYSVVGVPARTRSRMASNARSLMRYSASDASRCVRNRCLGPSMPRTAGRDRPTTRPRRPARGSPRPCLRRRARDTGWRLRRVLHRERDGRRPAARSSPPSSCIAAGVDDLCRPAGRRGCGARWRARGRVARPSPGSCSTSGAWSSCRRRRARPAGWRSGWSRGSRRAASRRGRRLSARPAQPRYREASL